MTDNINERCYVLLRRKSNLKLQRLGKVAGTAKEWQIQLGKDAIDIRDIVGHKFGSVFKLNHEKARSFKAVFTNSMEQLTDSVLEGIESGLDNRSQWDDGSSQKMSNDEIIKMRKEGVSATDLVKQLVENNTSFQQKTGFSQEKYVKKKEDKYFEYLEVLRPSIRLIAQLMYAQSPLKILNLRLDMLSQILTRANVMSGGRYLVFESSCQGLVTAAVLERVGSIGAVYQVHGGTTAPTHCIDAMNFPEATRRVLKSVSITHLRKLMNLKIDQNGDNREPEKAATETEFKVELMDSKIDQNEESHETEKIAVETVLKVEPEVVDPQLGKGGKRKAAESVDSEIVKKPKLSSKSWDEASAAWSEIQHSVDGLVVVTRQPEPLVLPLLRLLAPSRCFAIFSPHLEPLTACYTSIKTSGIALNLRISETWLRNYQVLPDRSHPEINMSGGGGYLLCGTTCISTVNKI